MPSVKAFIRITSTKKVASIRFRYTDGRAIQLFHKSEITISPDAFDTKKECVKAKIIFDSEKRKNIDKGINDRKELIKKLCIGIPDKSILSSSWLDTSIDKELHPEKYTPIKPVIFQTFFCDFDEFLQKRKLSDSREKGFMVLKRAMQRYELIRGFQWQLDSITSDTIKDFETFLIEEHTLFEKYKPIYDDFSAVAGFNRKTLIPQCRGMNYINGLFRKLRAFLNWCYDVEKTTNRPFKNYEGAPDLYGTPFYITIDERNTIYNTDLSHRPSLAIQRDIFVFQCLIGCRIGDFYKMTKQSVINGAIEYIPRKTKDGHPITVRVPLNDTAKMILKRYDSNDTRILPFISEPKYNQAIKEIFKIAGITRTVTVINSTTREEEKRPINEIASSHLARRTFIGNLYKLTKNADLTSSLSGHTDGSKAFFRYRAVDEDTKVELVKMLE